MREFFRYYFLKVLLGLVVAQLLFFFWLEKRNHRPVAVQDEISVFEGHSVKLRPLRNDTDKDEDELSLAIVSKPLQGEISQDEDLLVYSIGKGFAGVDSFAYTITDGKKESKEAFIKVNVNENLPPVANNDYIKSYPGKKIPIPVMGNDNDREDDSIFIKDITEPLHGKIVQEGDILFYASNSNKAVLDSFHYTLGDGFSFSEKASVKIDVKSKASSIYPWLSVDIGTPALPGNMAIKGGDLIVKGSGNDIWNNVDNFHYAYQLLDGDCEMITKIKSIENTHEWAKGGIMIRESLTGPSKNAYICLSPNNGINFQIRFDNGAGSTSENQRGEIEAPYWLKLVRKGKYFTGYRSPDGKEWTEVRNDSIDMPKIVYIGLATTSHNEETLSAVHYDLSKTILKKK